MGVCVGWVVGKSFRKSEWAQICRDYAHLEQVFPAWIDARRAERHQQAGLMERLGRWMQGEGGLDAPPGQPVLAWPGAMGCVTDDAIRVGPPEGFVEDALRRGRRIAWREMTGWTLQRRKGEGFAKTENGVPGELLLALLAAIEARFPGRIRMTALEAGAEQAGTWAGGVLGIRARTPATAAGCEDETPGTREGAAIPGNDLVGGGGGVAAAEALPAFLQRAPGRWRRGR